MDMKIGQKAKRSKICIRDVANANNDLIQK